MVSGLFGVEYPSYPYLAPEVGGRPHRPNPKQQEKSFPREGRANKTTPFGAERRIGRRVASSLRQTASRGIHSAVNEGRNSQQRDWDNSKIQFRIFALFSCSFVCFVDHCIGFFSLSSLLARHFAELFAQVVERTQFFCLLIHIVPMLPAIA